MLRTVVFCGALAATATAAVGHAQEPDKAKALPRLTKFQQESLQNEVLPAYWRGSPLGLLKAISPLIARIDGDGVAAINEFLRQQSVPPIDQLLAQARFALVQQGLTDDLPAPTQRELLITLVYFKANIDAVLKAREAQAALANPLPRPDNLISYRDLLWDIHVFQNELVNAGQVARYAAGLSKQGQRTVQRGLTDEQRQLLNTDFDALVAELDKTRRDLQERELELRVQRLDFALEVLHASKDSKERFLAAFAVDFDGKLLGELFTQLEGQAAASVAKTPPRGTAANQSAPAEQFVFQRERLNDIYLPDRIRLETERGRELAGDLIVKSRLLFDGIRWWTRGRYGRGPEAAGLLKNAVALRSPLAMIALSMPKHTPVPTDPVQSQVRVPDYDRRHHYIWNLEDREFQVSTATTRSDSLQAVGSPTNTGTDWFF